MPRVSVIMPVYNENESFLREAISSILSQTFSDFEFIIINDGSTNNSEEVILSYNDPRIVYLKNQENLKIIKSLNKGLELARGEYIARMDSDDISAHNRFELQVKYLDEHPNLALAGTCAIGAPINIKYSLPTCEQDIKVFLRYCANCIIHPTVMMRKSVLIEKGLKYKQEYPHAEDYKLWCDLSDNYDLANLPDVLLVHRLHKKSVSAKNTQEQQLISDKILFDCLLKDFPADKSVKKAINDYFSGDTISIKQLSSINRYLYKAVKKIQKNVFDSAKPYLKTRYKQIWLKFLSLAVYDWRFIMTLYLSNMSRITGLTLSQKLQIHRQKITEQIRKNSRQK